MTNYSNDSDNEDEKREDDKFMKILNIVSYDVVNEEDEHTITKLVNLFVKLKKDFSASFYINKSDPNDANKEMSFELEENIYDINYLFHK